MNVLILCDTYNQGYLSTKKISYFKCNSLVASAMTLFLKKIKSKRVASVAQGTLILSE